MTSIIYDILLVLYDILLEMLTIH